MQTIFNLDTKKKMVPKGFLREHDFRNFANTNIQRLKGYL